MARVPAKVYIPFPAREGRAAVPGGPGGECV